MFYKKLFLLSALLLLTFSYHVAHANEFEYTRINLATDGSEANNYSSAVDVDASGRYFVFSSMANNLSSNDSDNFFDIYIRDMTEETTEQISLGLSNQQAENDSYVPLISDDGKHVVFRSHANNIVSDDSNSGADVIFYNTDTKEKEIINVSSSGMQAEEGSYSTPVAINNNGRFVVFVSDASNLVENDTNGVSDVFIRDMELGVTERVSLSSSGEEGNAISGRVSSSLYSRELDGIFSGDVSDDGNLVTFISHATNFVDPMGTWNHSQLFLRDRAAGETKLISMFNGNAGNDFSSAPRMTSTGDRVVFQSFSDYFGTGRHTANVFTWVEESANAELLYGYEAGGVPDITNDGKYVTMMGGNELYDSAITLFQTNATNTFMLVSQDEINNTRPRISGSGEYIVFESYDQLVGDDTNNQPDIYMMRNPLLNTQNTPPILTEIGNQTVNEGETLTFTLSATDPDGDTLTYSATNTPEGAIFDPETATFSWTPTYAQAGNYPDVEFTVTDDGDPMELAVELITITVGNVNRAPVFDPVPPQEVLEEETLTFTVTASDPDNDTTTLSIPDLPNGAIFNATTGEFTWTPADGQDGAYVVTCIATDDGTPIATSTLQISITVGNNLTPEEKAENLEDTVVVYDFPKDIENSYLANLKKVSVFIQKGKLEPAINQLTAFIEKVETDYTEGEISVNTRNELVSLAQEIIDDLT